MSVYVFGEPGMVLVKVGVTADERGARCRALQRWYRSDDATFLYVNKKASGLAEGAAHRILRSRFWLEGEWFTCGADVAKAVVRKVIRRMEADRRASAAEYRRHTPEAVKRILSNVRRERRPLTEADVERCQEAWRAWEAAGNKRRRRSRRKPVA